MHCGILIINVIIAGYNLVEIIHKVHSYDYFYRYCYVFHLDLPSNTTSQVPGGKLFPSFIFSCDLENLVLLKKTKSMFTL